MRNQTLAFLLFSVLIMSLSSSVDARAKTCKPSGKIKGKKPPKDKCNQDHDSDCCESGKYYDTYKCSPPVTGRTKAVLTINGFGKGDDGGGPAECDGKYHSDDTPIVALSTGWFNNMKRCFQNITIHGNGKSVAAMVVDECDSTVGCDDEHDYQPPCPNNIVDASEAVWRALGVPQQSSHLCFANHPCCSGVGGPSSIKCSPPISGSTKAVLTINSFQKGGDGGGPSECDNQYHSDDTPVVALSTGWYSGGSRCLNNVTISGNGRSVTAMVVDECDSTMGCDEDHDYQPPCPNNIVDASKAVWKALGVPEGDWGELDITWSDA